MLEIFISGGSLGMEKILEINNLNKSFQDFALKDISFLWNQDILWALLGLMVQVRAPLLNNYEFIKKG